MRYLTAMFALCCQASHAQPLQMATPVTVFLTGTSVPPLVLQALENTAGAAFATSGVTLNWMEGRPPETGVDGQLVILHMDGQCRSSWPISTKKTLLSPSVVLGQTHIADGNVLPFADVLCDAVRQFVVPDLKGAGRRDRDRLFGRALGRVAAHELYHILLRTTEHAHTGISRAAQSVPELLNVQMAFSANDEERLFEAVSPDSCSVNAAGR